MSGRRGPVSPQRCGERRQGQDRDANERRQDPGAEHRRGDSHVLGRFRAGGRSGNDYTAGGFYGRVIGNHDWLSGLPNDQGDLGFKTYVEAAANQPPTVSLPGGAINYVENDGPTILSPTATVADADSANFDTGTLTVSLSANGSADDRLAIRNEGNAAGQIGVSGSTVTFGGTAIGTFAGGEGTTPLVVTLNASATPLATQALVRNLTYHNVSENPSTAARTVQVVLTDGDGGTSTPATKTVNVAANNDAPTIGTNAGLTLDEGATATITASLLAATDPDNTAAQLTYSVTTAPANGTLKRDGVAASTFTQADIDAGLITYVHNGSETVANSFSFTVTDGAATTPTTQFAITITPKNDAPVVSTNSGLTVTRSGTVAITAARLAATDPDNTPSQLVFSVTVAPAHGALLLNGSAVNSFTQADINAGLVSYQHDGNAAATDSFTFVVSDGNLSTNPTVVSIDVQSNDGSIIIISDLDLDKGRVTFTGDGGLDLDDHLELFAVDIGGGQYALGHNLTDPNLANNTDLDPVTPGAQRLILGSGTDPLIAVNLLAGNDSLQIDNTGGHFTTPVAYDGGTGADHLKLVGTLANTWTLTAANAGTVDGTPVSFLATENLNGSAGDDTFAFGATGSASEIDGGAGANTLDYRARTTPVEAYLAAGAATSTAGVANIGTVIGGSAADVLVGGPGGSRLIGNAGDDILLGGSGDDIVTGGLGNDLLIGGGGLDRVVESMPTELTITLTNTSLTGGSDTGLDVLSGIETAALTGGPGNNIIRASAFTLGSVTLAGGAGNDKLFGGPHADLLVGNDGNDNLVGGAGDDTFTGGLGNDKFNGGLGNDMVREENIAGDVTLTGSKLKSAINVLGNDTLVSIGRVFLSVDENDTVGRRLNAAKFKAGPVTLVGGAGADILIGTIRAGDLLMGRDGADMLDSGKGADTVDGGADVDIHVTLGDAALGDTIIDVP